MGIQNQVFAVRQVVMALGSVKSFRGYGVTGGVVSISDDDVVKHLDDTYSEVVICNINVKPGGALQMLCPMMFNSIKGEYQEELQMTLQSQILEGNDVDIEFHQ
jgi:hypothetical protein